MSIAFDSDKSGILGVCGIDVAVYGGANLTAEELETILDRCTLMFASNATVEEREIRFMEALDRSTNAAAALSLVVASIAEKQHEQDNRLVIIEECHKQQRRWLNVKMIGIGLAVSIAGLITSNLKHIAAFLKTIAK